jgi:hypothetical protein
VAVSRSGSGNAIARTRLARRQARQLHHASAAGASAGRPGTRKDRRRAGRASAPPVPAAPSCSCRATYVELRISGVGLNRFAVARRRLPLAFGQRSAQDRSRDSLTSGSPASASF